MCCAPKEAKEAKEVRNAFTVIVTQMHCLVTVFDAVSAGVFICVCVRKKIALKEDEKKNTNPPKEFLIGFE